jgi:hypothetical protein
MNRRLDDVLLAAKADAPSSGLERIESAVWRRIEAMRESRDMSSVFLPVRGAAVVAALGIGVAAGGFAAAEARKTTPEVSAFSVDARLAPSTLLDGQ